MSDEIVGPACPIGPFPGWDVPPYERLFLQVVSTLNGDGPLSLPRSDDLERNETRVALAVRDATGVSLEHWERLDPAGREPLLEATLAALSTPNTSGRAARTDSEEAPPLGGIPPEYREDEEPEGEPLTPAYMCPSADPIRHRKIGGEKWGFRSAYLSNHYKEGGGKTLTQRVKVGNSFAYRYDELLKLREKKLANEQKRYG